MKIGFDLTFIIDDTTTGVGRYAEDILNGFRDIGVLNECYLFVHESFYKKALERFSPANVVKVRSGNLATVLKSLHYRTGQRLERMYIAGYKLLQLTNEMKMDIIVHLFANNATRMKYDIPAISVIQDVYYKRFKNLMHPLSYKLFDIRFKNIIKHSDRIVTTTEFVKGDLLHYFDVKNPNYITVIPCPVEINKSTDNRIIKNKYILSVNALSVHKNYITLLKAFNQIKDRIEHQLIIVGTASNASESIEKYIIDNNLQSRVTIMQKITSDHLNNLYQYADLFVTTSLNEGFGRTPVEAAMHKVTVLSSKETSLPEATLKLLNYYEPALDHDILGREMLQLIEHRPTPEELQLISNKLKDKYDKVRIARQLYDLCTLEISRSIK